MTAFEDNPSPYLTLVEQAAPPSAAPAGSVRFYRDTDGKLYVVDDAAVATEVGGSGAGTAASVTYDNTTSGLTAVDVQDALDELAASPGGGGVIDSGAVLTKSAVQSIPINTTTAITFDGEVEDTDGYHSTSSNTSRLVAPATGVYIVSGTVEVASVASGKSILAWIRKNGADADGDGRSRVPGGAFPAASISTRVRMAAGDYVEIVVQHNDTVARDARESLNGTSFKITRLV
jgi:hypothetical protein